MNNQPEPVGTLHGASADAGGAPVVVCFGSNAGNREAAILNAIQAISTAIGRKPEAVSSIYETPSHNGFGDAYLNAVARFTVDSIPEEFEALTHRIEAALGRDRSLPHTVAIDIDTVVFCTTILRPDDYRRPHFRLGFSQLP